MKGCGSKKNKYLNKVLSVMGDTIPNSIEGKLYLGVLFVFTALFFGKCIIFQERSESFIILALVLIVFTILLGTTHEINIHISKYTSVYLFLISFFPRYFYYSFVAKYVTQVSDFAIAEKTAEIGVSAEYIGYYSHYLHKMIYPLFLHTFNITNQNRIVFFQCICLSFVAVVIYYIGTEIGGKKCGINSALLYSFFPSQVIYTQIITEEHVASLILVLLILCIIKLYDLIWGCGNTKIKTKIVIYSIIVGYLFASSAMCKDWGIIVKIASVICLFFLVIHGFKKDKFDKIKIAIISIVIIFIVDYSASFFYTQIGTKHLGGVKPENNVVVMQMFETLDPYSKGGYDIERINLYFDIVNKHNYNYEEANKEAMAMLLDSIKNNLDIMPKHLEKKGVGAYLNNNAMFDWAFYSEISEEFLQKYSSFMEIVVFIDNIYYCFLVILVSIAPLICKNYKLFFVQLICNDLLSSVSYKKSPQTYI